MRRRVFGFLLLSAVLIPQAWAAIERVELKLEGMT